MAFKHAFVIVCAITSIVIQCSASRTAPYQNEIWMLFARHPAKYNFNLDALLSSKGVKELNHVLKNAGTKLQNKLKENNPAFKQLNELLQLPSNRIQFEASDLRRSQLETLALRMTMEINGIGNNIAGSSFQIVHALAEVPNRKLSVQVNWQSSSRLYLYQPFFMKGPQKGKVDPNKKETYWQYLARGFMNFFFNKVE